VLPRANEPRQKGVGLLPIVQALRGHPQAHALIPHSLQHYLTSKVLPSAWYPELHCEELLDVLARTLESKGTTRDVWSFFGRVAAQRDLAGMQHEVSPPARIDSAGVYRKIGTASEVDVAGLFLRASKLWQLYHDTGEMLFARSPLSDCSVVTRLVGFRFVNRGALALHAEYMVEYGRLAGIKLRARVTRSTFDGATCCEWSYTTEPTEHNIAALHALPPLDDSWPTQASIARSPSLQPRKR